MLVRGSEGFGRDAAVIDELGTRAQVEHRADAERRHPGQIGAFDAVDAVGPVDQPPPHRAVAGRGVAAEVAEVEGPFERDPARTDMRFELHGRNVPAGRDTRACRRLNKSWTLDGFGSTRLAPQPVNGSPEALVLHCREAGRRPRRARRGQHASTGVHRRAARARRVAHVRAPPARLPPSRHRPARRRPGSAAPRTSRRAGAGREAASRERADGRDLVELRGVLLRARAADGRRRRDRHVGEPERRTSHRHPVHVGPRATACPAGTAPTRPSPPATSGSRRGRRSDTRSPRPVPTCTSARIHGYAVMHGTITVTAAAPPRPSSRPRSRHRSRLPRRRRRARRLRRHPQLANTGATVGRRSPRGRSCSS